VLGGFGLQFARGGDIGNQRKMHISTWLRPMRRPIWRAASRKGNDSMSPTVRDLDDRHIGPAIMGCGCAALDECLDLVGDMRNHLHVLPRYSPRRSLRITLSYICPVVKLLALRILAEMNRS